MGDIALMMSTFAETSAASSAMQAFVSPVIKSMMALASIAAVFFLILGGFHYITSSGDPDKLAQAKKIIKNAVAGLTLVIAASTLVAVLNNAYNDSAVSPAERLPQMAAIEQDNTPNGLVEVLINAITGVLKVVVNSIGEPFLAGLSSFTSSTPLMASNPSVFSVWLAIVGITDALFVIVVALIGFQVMSLSAFGIDEMDIKQLLPKVVGGFLLVNTSIFIIDAVISVSNAMITALNAAFPASSIWDSLIKIIDNEVALGFAALAIMVALIVLAIMLMIYYVLRLVGLYLGAVLSPLIFLLWLLPGGRDFAQTAAKTYVGLIFVLFVHVVILQLASSIIGGVATGSDGSSNALMSMIVGIATILALLKTQHVMNQLSYVSLGPRTATKLGGQFANVVNHYVGKTVSAIRNGHTTNSGPAYQYIAARSYAPRPLHSRNGAVSSRLTAANLVVDTPTQKAAAPTAAVKKGEKS